MKALALLVGFFTLSWGALVSGTVYDKSTSKPIADAIVIADNKEYRTDCNGSFIVPSTGIIGVRAIGYDRKFYKSGGKMYLNPFTPKALYLSSFGATSSKIMGNAKNLLQTTEINAFVIDVKMDRGQVAFKTDNPMANKIGAQDLILFKDMKKFVADLHKEGVYVIARIVSFKDTPYVTANPQYGVHTREGGLFKDKEGLYWIDASRKEPRKYILSIAEEAAAAGFDEIQFDYVRFPDRKGIKFAVENTQAERVKAISGFLEEARRTLLPYNVFL
ncbi:MAG: putative glycoside hydrolase, partial [Sulfuricurvum sp.]|uniref:putative glycoside hydrolase n=1 Tax=Sulfuricurvum sp. TaxID=2025608 RepID=UPI00260BD1BD